MLLVHGWATEPVDRQKANVLYKSKQLSHRGIFIYYLILLLIDTFDSSLFLKIV